MSVEAVPSRETVQAYLAAHQLESVLEDAVNEAVLKLQPDPFQFIADRLAKHSYGGQGAAGPRKSTSRRVSLGGVPLNGHERRVSLSEETFIAAKDQAALAAEKKRKASLQIEEDPDRGKDVTKEGEYSLKSGEELTREYTKADVAMPKDLEDMLRAFFDKMDIDKDGTVTKEEATKFWGKNFAKVNANSMFNEVDEDGDLSITWDEFHSFWQNVIASGYEPEDIKEEVEMMMEGGSWVDFDDGRTT